MNDVVRQMLNADVCLFPVTTGSNEETSLIVVLIDICREASEISPLVFCKSLGTVCILQVCSDGE